MVKELSNKTAPLGVKIISISGIIVFSLGVIWGIIVTIMSFFPSNDSYAGFDIFAAPLLLMTLLPILIFSIFLLKLKNWARIVIIVFGFLNIFNFIISLPILIHIGFNWFVLLINIIPFLISLVVSLYLLLNKNVKEAFK